MECGIIVPKVAVYQRCPSSHDIITASNLESHGNVISASIERSTGKQRTLDHKFYWKQI